MHQFIPFIAILMAASLFLETFKELLEFGIWELVKELFLFYVKKVNRLRHFNFYQQEFIWQQEAIAIVWIFGIYENKKEFVHYQLIQKWFLI